LIAFAVAGLLFGAGGFESYPRVELATDALTWTLAAASVLAGLAPMQLRRARRRSPRPEVAHA
jgi:hypothetical protein